jgi:hypothetical protein
MLARLLQQCQQKPCAKIKMKGLYYAYHIGTGSERKEPHRW